LEPSPRSGSNAKQPQNKAMDKIINFQILKHPINWIIVILMVLIAGIAFHFFMQYQTGSNPAKTVTT
jgi:hypothetical protein